MSVVAPNDEFVCWKCQIYLKSTSNNVKPSEVEQAEEDSSSTIPICSVCMGLWNPRLSSQWLQKAIEEACEPYGGIAFNRFCTLPNHGPTLSICGDVYLHYQRLSKASSSSAAEATPFSVYLHDLKQELYQRIQKIIADLSLEDMPPILSNSEQQGFLSMHILCIPPKGKSMLDKLTATLVAEGNNSSSSHKRKRSRQQHKGPFTTQGGDPRVSLERRLQEVHGYQWWTLAEAELALTTNTTSNSNPTAITTLPMECHAAVFRRPIFLYGYYTKSRRDVSQTPFVVVDKKQDRQGTNNDDDHENQSSVTRTTTTTMTLGVTSVEEEICRPIIELVGISTRNNLPTLPIGSSSSSSNNAGSVQYGMCKFHASGREDMDVRMLLRPTTSTTTNQGRPFCVQIVDALKPLQTQQQLEHIVNQINAGDGPSSPLWYGSNPMGVGISGNLKLVSANNFSGLQADTENKVKHYGCHCWSEQELPLDWTFDLAAQPQPLTIQQRTPLRVLHRRPNLIRERQILAAQAQRLDAHHFRLELTTQAGTYVKEFVHGDLRRTTPSMASILGTKTNILLLDCEGIEIDDHTASTGGLT